LIFCIIELDIVNIYGHCSNSALFDFCGGGNLFQIFESKPSSIELLRVAFEVTASVADAHNFDSMGRPTIAHTDIKPDQWLLGPDGHYRLNDFNRARFLGWDQEENVTCPFRVGKNPGIWRSPEEYKYDDQSNKGDVYSLGNILYYLLTGKQSYSRKTEDAADLVINGHHPKIKNRDLLERNTDSGSAIRRAINKAMMMCFVTDPIERLEAREIAKFLKRALDKYDH